MSLQNLITEDESNSNKITNEEIIKVVDEAIDEVNNIKIKNEAIKKKFIFFNRNNVNKSKSKPKPIVYNIFICTKYKTSENINDDLCYGCWSFLCIQQPQDAHNNQQEKQTTYMVSNEEISKNHVHIRLLGIIEILKWITCNIDELQYPSVHANIVSNDVFVVNLLKEWIPKWHKNNFCINKNDNEKRPNYVLLEQISNITSRINLSIKWEVEKSNNLLSVVKKVDEMMENIKI
jgi:hypothetical protein